MVAMDETELQQLPEPEGGDCFTVALQLGTRITPDEVIDHASWNDIQIVHGLPVGTGPLNRGKRYWHAWVEVKHRTRITPEVVAANPAFAHFGSEIVTELVVDRSNGNDMAIPKAVFYNVGQLDEEHVWRYTMNDARARSIRAGNYGPWVDGWEEMGEV